MPFIILAAAVAALVYLIQNPEARQKAREVAIMIQEQITQFLWRTLPKALFDAFKEAMKWVANAVWEGIKKVVGYFLDMPRQILGAIGSIVDAILGIPRAIEKALASLGKLDKAAQNSIPLPGNRYRGYAEGGWVGLHGPELAMVGERGPEYVVPNHRLNGKGSGDSVTLVGVSRRDIAKIVDESLYFQLRRATTTIGRKTV
jgi:SLT domain-containing protein